MTRPLVIVRPEPGCSATVAAARAAGLEAIASPLFEIEPAGWTPPDPDQFDALLAGSANAFRHVSTGLSRLAALPVYAVGERTSEAAREAGFTVARTGNGDMQALVDALSPPLRLLRLAGEVRTEIASPPGIEVAECVLYRAAPRVLAEEAARALREGGCAALHSGEAARRFAHECDRLDIPRTDVALVALSPRIAGAAGAGWGAVRTAPEVSDAALLVLAAQLCQ
ncbi:uroporphyrinogen-III synthase [Tsuneonella amylolytica]|uniref:uroporphyrinogen-III synthase n=1 Tax=Tsuneonella amylolytica TaxID=2338327 RepID=UPI000EA8DB19|nr:uroporphyrinogen-III synthase [Tsuneonella amylolytica]